MISKAKNTEAFVWIWLPNATEPVVAGKLDADNGNILFNYGKSYLELMMRLRFMNPNCHCKLVPCLCLTGFPCPAASEMVHPMLGDGG